MFSFHFQWLLVAFLFFSNLADCSSRNYRVVPVPRSLKIDDKSFKFENYSNRPKVYLGSDRLDEQAGRHFIFDPIALKVFYQVAEDGFIERSKLKQYDPQIFYIEIFEMNRFYSYTPAEWAIHNNQIKAFTFFLKRALMTTFSETRIEYHVKYLMALAIQYNNLDAANAIFDYTVSNFMGKGFLSIAVQHHVSHDFIHFLCYKCGLIDEIDDPSADNVYPKPLNYCAKFNNSNAAIFLIENGARFGAKAVGERDGSFLATVMLKKRKRMLANIIKEIPFLCQYRDFEGNTLMHYAALYSPDAEMIRLVREICPNLSIDVRNQAKSTPLASVLTLTDGNIVEAIAFELIKLGANPTIMSNDRISPLDLIVKFGDYEIFTFLLNYSSPDLFSLDILQRLTDSLSINSLWSWMDLLLKKFPGIDRDWIDFSRVNFEKLLEDGAYLTFEIALSKNALNMPSDFVEQIVQAGNKKFLSVAINNGFNVNSIDVSRLYDVEIGPDMIGFIKGLQTCDAHNDTELIVL